MRALWRWWRAFGGGGGSGGGGCHVRGHGHCHGRGDSKPQTFESLCQDIVMKEGFAPLDIAPLGLCWLWLLA